MESIFEIVPDSSQEDKIQHNPRKKQTTLSPLTSSFCSKTPDKKTGPSIVPDMESKLKVAVDRPHREEGKVDSC